MTYLQYTAVYNPPQGFDITTYITTYVICTISSVLRNEKYSTYPVLWSNLTGGGGDILYTVNTMMYSTGISLLSCIPVNDIKIYYALSNLVPATL